MTIGKCTEIPSARNVRIWFLPGFSCVGGCAAGPGRWVLPAGPELSRLLFPPQALSVGIFPYVLKLLQSSARELRPLLVFIWAKILAVDSVSTREFGCFFGFSARSLFFPPRLLYPVALELRLSPEVLQKDAVLSGDQRVISLIYSTCMKVPSESV